MLLNLNEDIVMIDTTDTAHLGNNLDLNVACATVQPMKQTLYVI